MQEDNFDSTVLDEMFVEAQRAQEEGNIEIAIDLFSRLTEIWGEVEGVTGSKTLVMRGSLGRALTDGRRYEAAETVLAELLIDRESVLGPDDEQTFVTRGNLARAIALGGRPEEGIHITRMLLADRERVNGADDPRTLNSRGQIAEFYLSAGGNARAAELFGELLIDRERVLGSTHWDTERTRQNFIIASAKSNPNPETVGALRELFDQQVVYEGLSNPDVINTYAVLANLTAFSLGDPLEGLGMLTVVVAERTKLFGPGSPLTLASRRGRARCLILIGQFDDAVSELEDSCVYADEESIATDLEGMGLRMDLVWARMARLEAYIEENGAEEFDFDGDAWATTEFFRAQSDWTSLEEDSRWLEPEHGLRRETLRMKEEYGFSEESEDSEPEPELISEILPDPTADARHMIHYKFGFGVIPLMVFSPGGMEFVFELQDPNSNILLANMWAKLCKDQTHLADRHEFEVQWRFAPDDDVLVVIKLPEVRAAFECSFVGIRLDHKTVSEGAAEAEAMGEMAAFVSRAPEGSARVMHLESTDFGGTMIGETANGGAHLNRGFGPEPSFDAMFSILESLGDDEVDDEEFSGDEPFVQRRANWIRRFLARQLRRLDRWLKHRRERRDAR